VAGGYFDTVGLPLLQGRGFGPADAAAQPVAVVNETLARRLDPDGLPLGQRIALGKNPERRLEVIGVVRDAKYRSLSESPRPMFYEPLSQTDSAQMTLLLRVDGDPAALAEPVRREIQSLNLDNAVVTIRTLEDQFREAAAPSRQRAIVLSVICGIGLLLSAFGLFGVMSYGVRRQVRELGVRMALGARPSDIGIMVLRQALRLVGTGLGIGLIAAFGATQVIKSALFGVSAHDPLTLCLVAGLLGGVGAAAVYLPARWAMRVDPMLSIRADR
jgi:predicted permease